MQPTEGGFPKGRRRGWASAVHADL